MKRIILLTFMALTCLTLHAQVPQYAFWNPAKPLGGQGFAGPTPTFLQAIYHPGDFPSAPAGRITNIYFRIAFPSAPKGTSAVYYGWRVRIGNTSLDTFRYGSDTALWELMTIMDVDSFVVPHSDSNGAWVQIPLGNNVFNFSRTQNFVVEYAFDSSYNGFMLYRSALVSPKHWRYIVGPRSTMIGSAYTTVPPDLGIDLIPVGVNDADNIQSFGLFPNPSRGRFVVSFEAQRPVRQVRLTVRNMLGQEVYRQSYQSSGTSFFKEVSPGTIPKGLYLVEVVADGQRIVRKLQIE